MKSDKTQQRQSDEEVAAAWLAQRDTGPWAPADEAAFEEWLASSTSRRVAYYRLKRTWQEVGRLGALSKGSLPKLPLAHVFGDAAQPGASAQGWFPWKLFALAASLLLVAGIGFFAISRFPTNEFRTPVGGIATIPVGEGSKVTLNTDSEVRVELTDSRRTVSLEKGEAFFEVMPDARRPFVVKAGGKRITVLGTAFSVRRDAGDIRVSVTEGRVRVESAQPAIVTAGETAQTEGVAVLVHRKALPEIERNLTWRTGMLTFEKTPLADAVAEFNRYNERKIFIDDPALAATEVGGVFRSTDVAPFIHLIQDGLGIEAREDERSIRLSRK